MRSMRKLHAFVLLAGLFLGRGAWAEESLAHDRIVGAVSPEGRAHLVKVFQVPEGTLVSGVEFLSNDVRTVFPRVALLRGAGAGLSDMEPLVVRRDVRPDRHRVRVNFPAVAVGPPGVVYVAISLPPSSGVRAWGEGAGIAARAAGETRNSYFVVSDGGHLGVMDVEYAIELLVESASKVAPASGEPVERALGPASMRVSPNPSGLSSQIEFVVPRRAHVQILVYDVAGRLVRESDRGELPPGVYQHEWDGTDGLRQRVGAGIYVARVRIGDAVLTRKLVRLE